MTGTHNDESCGSAGRGEGCGCKDELHLMPPGPCALVLGARRSTASGGSLELFLGSRVLNCSGFANVCVDDVKLLRMITDIIFRLRLPLGIPLV